MSLQQFSFTASRIYNYLISFAYLLAMGAVVVLPQPNWAKIALGVLLIIGLLYQLQYQGNWQSANAYCGLKRQGEHWFLIRRQGEEIAVKIEQDSLVTPWLMVLNWRQVEAKRLHSLVLFPDSLPKNELRRLRVELKWGL